MPWRPALSQLRDALAELYPDVADARRVAAGALLPLDDIVLHGRARTVWQSILQEAVKQDCVQAIIEAARGEYGENPALVAAVEAYRRDKGQEPSPTRVATASRTESPPPVATSHPSRKGRRFWVIAGGILSVIMVFLVMRWVLGSMEPDKPKAIPETQHVGTNEGVLATPEVTPDALVLELVNGVTVPLVRVPAGEFLMGSADTDSLASDDEKPEHKVWLPEYLIGKYEVTVAQYRAFVQATGYQLDYPDAREKPDDHPVANVTWHDAMAFCDWASQVSGRQVRLPSEAEWEKAARGMDGRIYPWGDRWDPGRCNSEEKGPGRTTSVGHYSPLGDSPYGCADMAGNELEWTRSLSKPYPYEPNDGRENTDTRDKDRRVLRGGSFNSNEGRVRCAVRRWYGPNLSVVSGFRVVVVPISL